MRAVRPCPLPDSALLAAYRDRGAYTDCFATGVARRVAHAEYVAAFYTTTVFKLERLILKLAIARPSTDDQARRLAAGELSEFAAWKVAQRSDNQLLLADVFGRTCSWLMTEPVEGGTRLYFGSAVVPKGDARDIGWSFRATVPLHVLYSRTLLGAARRRLEQSRP